MYSRILNNYIGLLIVMLLGLNGRPATAQFGDGRWIVNDPEARGYLPFISGAVESNALSFMIEAAANHGKSIRICAEQGSSILIEANLAGFFERTSCLELDLDSLKKIYSKDRLFFTIYNPDLNFSSNYRYAIVTPGAISEIVRNDLELYPIPRDNLDFRNFFVLGLTLVLLLLAGFFSFQSRTFRSFYDLRSILSIRSRSNLLQSFRLFERINLLFISFHSLLMGFLVVVGVSTRQEWIRAVPGFDPGDLGNLMIYWGLITIVLLIFYIIKYGLIVQLSRLFGLQEFRDQHFLDYLRLSMVFFLVFFGLVVLINLATRILNIEMVSLLIDSAAVFMLLRVLIIFFKLNSLSSYHRLHLFSYLWSTEVLPLVFILKLFV